MEVEELKKLILERIRQLEHELQLYRRLLEIIDECSSGGLTLLQEIRDEEGNVKARIYGGPSLLKLVFEKPVERDSTYINFMLKKLRRLQEEGAPISFELEGDEETVTAVKVKGRFENEELQKYVYNILRFVASKITHYT